MRNAESWIVSFVLNSLWQVPLLVSAGWLAARFVRRMGAAAEHRVWMGVFFLDAAIPAVCSLGPDWFPLFPQWGFGHAVQGTARVSAEMGAGLMVVGWHANAGFLRIAALAYCAVTAYFAARFIWRCVRLAQIRKSAKPLDLAHESAALWRNKVRRFREGTVSLAASERVATPVTIGIRHKLILLPVSMAERITDADLGTVIEHELAHVERNDFAKNLACEFLALAVSYHPLLRYAREQLAETREMACDERASQASSSMEYGRSLLRLASMLVSQPAATPNAIGILDAHTLERRLMRLKNRTGEMKGGRRIASLFACGVLAAATCGSALALHMNVDANAGAEAKSAQTSEKVPAGAMAGNLISKVTPKYPPEAKKKHIQGKVVLDAAINKDGDITNLKVVSGPTALRKSALDAVKQWKYKPYLHNGKPVEVQTTINISYSLDDGSAARSGK